MKRCYACILEAQPDPPSEPSAPWVISALAAIVSSVEWGPEFLIDTILACEKHRELMRALIRPNLTVTQKLSRRKRLSS